jgi:CO/xanthine dehydrogenase FAD-binding subunit
LISNYETPANIGDAHRLLGDGSKICVVLGGGTLLIPVISEGGADIDTVVDIRMLHLDRVEVNENSVVLGSSTTISQLARVKELAFLSSIVRNFGAPAIRNLASLGGNIMVGGDLSSALLALEATVKLQTREGEVTVMLLDMYERDDLDSIILLEIDIPFPMSRKFGYYKLGRRLLNSHSVVSATVFDHKDGHSSIGLSGVAKKPLLLKVPSQIIGSNARSDLEQTLNKLLIDVELLNDAHASSRYRRRMIPVAVQRAIDIASIG